MKFTSDVLPVMLPADHVADQPQGHWTYTDYAALSQNSHRYEIIDGVLYMAPAPNTHHQSSSVRFVFHLVSFVELGGLGRVFHAPIDVELAANRVVQPDVVVVLNKNLGIITDSRLIGAPDLVIEIISPSTAGYDRRDKQDAYAAAGVQEYWIADPAARAIELLVLDNSSFRPLNVFRGQALLPSVLLPGFPVVVEQFFA